MGAATWPVPVSPDAAARAIRGRQILHRLARGPAPDGITLNTLRDEFAHFYTGLVALTESMADSQDPDDVRRITETFDQWRRALYDAESPVSLRLQEIEIAERTHELTEVTTS